MANLCIIPARGGSKRIPKKNSKLFLGVPIIVYAIKTALASKLFDEVMVSTDDAEIAKIAIENGAKVPFLRSEKNADDFATTYDVLEEVITAYAKKGIQYDAICCLYPCTPLLKSDLLKKAYKKLVNEKQDVVFPVLQYSFPIQRAVKIVENKLEMFSKKHLTTRSQDLEASYHDAGQFYWANTLQLLKNKTLLPLNTGAVVISEMEAQDIDTLTDWKLATLKYKVLHNE